ncbi:MAG: methyltransferase [Armatimonadota bacterium]
MSRAKKFIGFWIALLVLGVVLPGLFYLASVRLNVFLNMPPGLNLFGAAIFAGFGLFWILWAYSYLHFVGRGSPIEAFGVALLPTERLVTTGPYAYTRNPMILGELLLLVAVALYARSLAGLVLVPALALLAVWYARAFEEPGLARRFGDAYRKYKESVPTLLPRRPRR